jgi:predicted MPP superfamily phosphohydrolase
MHWLNVIYWILSFIGHVGLWCMLYNHTHATSWPRIVRKRCEKFIIVATAAIFVWFCIWLIRHRTIDFWERELKSFVECGYLFMTMAMGIFLTVRWVYRKSKSNPNCVLDRQQSLTDVQSEIGRSVYLTPVAQKLGMIPFNQAHKLAVDRIRLGIKRLPLPLEGFRICQLSDFHLTGQMDLEWFEHVVAKANEFDPDLILITGDLIDEAPCLDWIEPVFGRLKAKHGIFFVRGNHDLRIKDQQYLLQRLESVGMRWIGGKWERLEIEGVGIYLAGNELPWFAGAEDLSKRPHQVHGESGMEDLPCLKILLSHTPDQITWAKDYDFDLIFAGHNHGGQIAIPYIGPIVAPSRHGVLYASGTFAIGDAVMHVSRGLSGDECIRINCPPEVGLFTIERT